MLQTSESKVWLATVTMTYDSDFRGVLYVLALKLTDIEEKPTQFSKNED